MLTYLTTRQITITECPWLDGNIDKGTYVYEFTGHTYGCITPGNKAYTLQPYGTPFFELPNNAVELDLWESD